MDLVFPTLTLLLLIGAVILWRKTKRLSVLLQLFAASVLFVVIWLELLAQFLAIVCGRTEFLDALRTSTYMSVQWVAFVISGFAFPIGYICYAITHKRI
jgi:hypothetical protein